MRTPKICSIALFLLAFVFVSRAQAQSVPRYKVDASWPKELPNNWILWNSTGLVIDKNDHIWVLNRPRQVSPADAAAAQKPPIGECCIPAPSIVEFDTQ